MEKIIVIGGKGTAVNLALSIQDARIKHDAPQELLGFAIDDPELGSEIRGIPIVCNTRNIMEKFPEDDIRILFCLYRPDVIRERIGLLASFAIPEEKFARFVHPLSYVASTARIGPGSSVLANATVQDNVRLGCHCIVNANVGIEHDTTIGDSNFIAAGACIGRNVSTGTGVFIGLNASVREEVSLGAYSILGMGSTLLSDLPPDATAFGNPARIQSC